MTNSKPQSVAEKTERLTQLQTTLREKGGDFERLAEEMDFLWDHPDHFEDGELAENWRDDDLLLVFNLGVVFGIDYEQAYPAGERDEWPVPLEDRPKRGDH